MPSTASTRSTVRPSELLALGARAVLLKGGHLPGDEVVDLLAQAERRAPAPRLGAHRKPQPARHGLHAVLGHRRAPGARATRCPQPWRSARAYVIAAMAAGADVQVGAGHGPLNHGFAPVPTRPPAGAGRVIHASTKVMARVGSAEPS